MLAKQLSNLELIIEDGNSYALYSGGNPCNLLFLDGAGTPFARRISQRLPMLGGVQDKGYRYDARKMILGLYVYGIDERAASLMLDKLAYIFTPTVSPLKLRATRLDGSIRQIDCYLDGTMDFPMSTRMNGAQQILVPLTAPDPSFYNPVQQVSTQSLSTGGAFITPDVTGTTANEWPVIEITGPITNPYIFVTPLNSAIQLTSMGAGETVQLDLRPGFKTLRIMSSLALAMNRVDPTSYAQFSRMRIQSEKETQFLAPGTFVSSWSFIGSGTSGASSVTMRWYKRYGNL